MPAVNDPRGPGSPGGRSLRFRSLPPWLQWVLPFGVAGAAVLAVVLFVNHETTGVPPTAAYNSPAAVAEQHREDTLLVRQEQAPHEARLRPGTAPAAGVRAAVVAYLTREIDAGTVAGPITRAVCRPSAGTTPARRLFRCRVTASAQVVTYPFDAVVAPAARAITFCQRVMPPVPSMNVPVSRRCT